MKKLYIGQKGEKIAADYIQKLNFKIIAKNFKIGHLELDLIAQKNKSLYFFEIKTRQNTKVVSQDNILTKNQIINLKKAAKIYLTNNKCYYRSFHFNLIIVILNLKNKNANIIYYPDIF